MSLDFYQIIYKEEQRSECYPFAKVYFNDTLTDYFENSVICKLVPESNADLISVCSWRLKQKRGESSTPDVLKNRLELSEEKILSHDFDVAILTPRRASHVPLYMASEWHGAAWDQAFEVFQKEFLKPMGIRVPDYRNGHDLKRAIYENHFICKRDLYKRYVDECLSKAISHMEHNPTYSRDANYITKKRDTQEVKEYQKKSGRTDWPIAPFILERLFSIWINDKDLKVINL